MPMSTLQARRSPVGRMSRRDPSQPSAPVTRTWLVGRVMGERPIVPAAPSRLASRISNPKSEIRNPIPLSRAA